MVLCIAMIGGLVRLGCSTSWWVIAPAMTGAWVVYRNWTGDERPAYLREHEKQRALIKKHFGDAAQIERLWAIIGPREGWRISSVFGEVEFGRCSLWDVVGEEAAYRRALLMCSELWGSVVVNGSSTFVTSCAAHASDLGIVLIPEIYDSDEVLAGSLLAGLFGWFLVWLAWDLATPENPAEWITVTSATMAQFVAYLVYRVSWKYLDGASRFDGRRDGLVYRRTTPPAFGTSGFFDRKERGIDQ
jgi:hypothetical protein